MLVEVLGEVDRRADGERNGDRRAQHDEDDCPDDGDADPAGLVLDEARLWIGAQEVPVDRVPALLEQVADDEQTRAHDDDRRKAAQNRPERAAEPKTALEETLIHASS